MMKRIEALRHDTRCETLRKEQNRRIQRVELRVYIITGLVIIAMKIAGVI